MGCKLTTPHFVLLVSRNSAAVPRLGITVSRRVGNAVVRNRLKRKVREYFRLHRTDFQNCDYLVIARSRAGKLHQQQIDHHLERLFTKEQFQSGLIDSP